MNLKTPTILQLEKDTFTVKHYETKALLAYLELFHAEKAHTEERTFKDFLLEHQQAIENEANNDGDQIEAEEINDAETQGTRTMYNSHFRYITYSSLLKVLWFI